MSNKTTMRFGIFAGIFNIAICTHVEHLIRRGHEVDVYFEAFVGEQPFVLLAPDVLGSKRLRIFAAPKLPETKAARAAQFLTYMVRATARHPTLLPRLALDREEKTQHSKTSLMCLFRVASNVPIGGSHYDFVHAHSAVAGRRLALLRDYGILTGQLVVSFQGMDATTIRSRGLEMRYQKMFRTLAACTVQTEYMRSVVSGLGAAESKIVKIPASIDIERLQPLMKSSIAPDDQECVQIITVARFIEVKGYEYAIRAVARLLDQGVDLKYTMVGTGPLKSQMEALVEELGIQSHVRFTGGVSLQAAYEEMATSDIFFLPGTIDSHGAQEAMGLVSLEAQMLGLPVVLSRIGGLPETVADEGSAVLIEHGNVDDAVRGLQEMIARRSEWPSMIERGRAFIARNFAIQSTAALFDTLYERLCSGKSPRI